MYICNVKDFVSYQKQRNSGISLLYLVMIMFVYNLFDEILIIQADIEAALYNMCNLLPQALADKCTYFVTSYSEKIIERLAGLSPLKVCIRFGLCDRVSKCNNTAEKNGEVCELCLKVHI